MSQPEDTIRRLKTLPYKAPKPGEPGPFMFPPNSGSIRRDRRPPSPPPVDVDVEIPGIKPFKQEPYDPRRKT